MRAEFIAEVPQELKARGKYQPYLAKLYSGDEKCVLFTLDSPRKLTSAYNAVRYHLKRNADAGTFRLLKNLTTNQLYVYKA